MRFMHRRRTFQLTAPITVGGRTLTERTVLELQMGERYAEVSPLPGLHTESIDDVIRLLPEARAMQKKVRGSFLEKLTALNNNLAWQGLPPSLRLALEGMLHGSVEDFERPIVDLPLTARLVDQDPGGDLSHLAKAPAAKVKVGRRDRELEAALVREVRDALPEGAEIRLDANRAFSLDEAVALAGAVDLTPAFIEEPLADPGEVPAFCERTGWPVALDESLHEPRHADLLTCDSVAAWVVKPALLGLLPTLQLFDRAPDGVTCVVSACFEGPVGLGLLMELAEVAPGHPAPGLGTVFWLADDGRPTPWKKTS